MICRVALLLDDVVINLQCCHERKTTAATVSKPEKLKLFSYRSDFSCKKFVLNRGLIVRKY